MVMFGTIALTGYLYSSFPRASSRLQDTGMLFGVTEASQDISFPAMAERQQALMDTVLKDPAVESVSDFMGPGGSTADAQPGPHVRRAQAARPAQRQRRPGDRAAAAATGESPGRKALSAAGAGHHDRRPASPRPSTSTRCPTPIRASSITGRTIFLDKLKSIPQLTDVATDQENAGPMLNVTTNREVASSFGILP